MSPTGKPKFRYVGEDAAAEAARNRRLFKSKGAISIAKAVIENEALPDHNKQTMVAIATQLGVKVDSVYQVAARLRRKGRIKGSVRQTTGAASPSTPPTRSRVGSGGPPPTEAMNRAMLGDFSGIEVMDKESRLRGLSFLATAAPPAVQVQAYKALNEMERETGVQAGPPPPLTDEEMVGRLADLLGAAGPSLAFEAMKRAFPEVAK